MRNWREMPLQRSTKVTSVSPNAGANNISTSRLRLVTCLLRDIKLRVIPVIVDLQPCSSLVSGSLIGILYSTITKGFPSIHVRVTVLTPWPETTLFRKERSRKIASGLRTRRY